MAKIMRAPPSVPFNKEPLLHLARPATVLPFATYVPQAIIDLAVDVMSVVMKCSPRPKEDRMTPELSYFISFVVSEGPVNIVTILVALIYVDRFVSKLPPTAVGSYDTKHRLFMVALMLASKYLNDQSLTNKAWSKISGVFQVSELNMMEIDFLTILNYDLHVDRHSFDRYLTSRLAKYDYNVCSQIISLTNPVIQTITSC